MIQSSDFTVSDVIRTFCYTPILQKYLVTRLRGVDCYLSPVSPSGL
jgi:hypothetical protein